ncbi:MAG: 16S rRNA (cytidine(1402)-2'-O)-methyltransferase [Alphaproteobacteria bacterium]
MEKGALYVVATPIGNLGDMSQRAIEVLQGVDLIAAEDTRHSGALLRHFGITTPCMALHEHNERKVAPQLLARLAGGKSLALISDAGTPLLSDPGFHLLQAAIEAGIRIIPIPGPSALVTALSAAGLPTDRFCFEGFLPSKAAARRKRLEALREAGPTLVFYEAPHRIEACLADLQAIFGAERPAVLARELTKTFETFLRGSLADIAARVAADPDQRKGEMVLIVGGKPAADREETLGAGARHTLQILLEELPLKQAARLAAEITGEKKNRLYRLALELTGQSDA